jgi:hypothetical protein
LCLRLVLCRGSCFANAAKARRDHEAARDYYAHFGSNSWQTLHFIQP